MNKEKVRAGLKEFDKTKVDIYINYLHDVETAKDWKTKKVKNPWFAYCNDEYLINCYKKVAVDRLDFDGKHITLQKTGISYDYNAYKNKMFLVYPESLIDVELVYKTDVFEIQKKSGKVIYSHQMIDPFSRNESDIVGGYCIIKNKRGEFATLLSKADIEKHRKVAKTDSIWKQWLTEMYLKTVIKKGCNQHFKDIYENMINTDNENYDLENPLDIEVDVKGKIESINTVEELKEYFLKEKDNHKADATGFNKLITKRKEELENDS